MTTARRRTGRPPTIVDGRTMAERLLISARALFAEKGFEATSVQDVVDAAGVTKGAMYHYFSAKDDLLQEIYSEMLREQSARLKELAQLPLPIRDRVRTVAADVIASTAENLEATTVTFRSLHLLPPAYQSEIRRARRAYHEEFRALISEGQRAGVFREDVSAELATDFYFGAVHHLPMWWHPDGPLTGQQVGEVFAAMFIDGLTPR